MSLTSSHDLHPTAGARFVFERTDDGEAPRYRVSVYLPNARALAGALEWTDGEATLDLSPAGDDDETTWARAEALKLARVLKRDPKPRMTRWRG